MNAGGYIFNTEAHPIDPGALHCCSRAQSLFPEKKSSLRKFVSVEDCPEEDTSSHIFEEEEDIRNESKKDKSIEIVKLSEMRQLANLSKENTTESEENEATVENIEDVEIEVENVSSETSKIQIVSPPNVIYKADDSENIEAYDMGRGGAEYSSSAALRNRSAKLQEQVPKKKFEPQAMLENIRKRNLYPTNLTTKFDYQTLSCRSQPFLQRISIVGEFF